MSSLDQIWVYLAGSPLLALILTLFAYHTGYTIYINSNKNPLLNPVAIAVLIVATAIELIDMPYATYFSGAQFVHFLLGTATVSLAIPIYKGMAQLKQHWLVLLVAQLSGGATSIGSAVLLGKLFQLPDLLSRSLYAKSITAPIGMGVAEQIGASPTLTAVYAVITGVMGAAMGRFIFDAIGCSAWWQRGFAIGTAAHGIGTSRAFSVSEEAGAFASLAMGMHGIIGAIVIPRLVL